MDAKQGECAPGRHECGQLGPVAGDSVALHVLLHLRVALVAALLSPGQAQGCVSAAARPLVSPWFLMGLHDAVCVCESVSVYPGASHLRSLAAILAAAAPRAAAPPSPPGRLPHVGSHQLQARELKHLQQVARGIS